MTIKDVLLLLDDIIADAEKARKGKTSQDRLASVGRNARAVKAAVAENERWFREHVEATKGKPIDAADKRFVDVGEPLRCSLVAKARAMGYSWEQIKQMSYNQLRQLAEIGE